MTIMQSTAVRACLALTAVSISMGASAGIRTEATRVIYKEGMPEATLRAENLNKVPVILQSWVDTLDEKATPATTKAPVMVLPPVARVDTGKSQVLRMKLTAVDLPSDRESAYWLNIMEVPSGSAEENSATVHLVLRNRLKIFYRPKSLNATAAIKAPDQVQWSVVAQHGAWALQAKNDSPYHVSMVDASLVEGKRETAVRDMDMLRPYSHATFKLPGVARMPTGATLKIKYVNDFGGVISKTVPLQTP
ncbi:fimbrial biogenesis chaperone [Stenotrophomonas maltophilia]|uniref:fimbrial biogenesis chaperone n=1 Tax=Stenotrophomonas maltophilia group sp. Smal13 TaxID=3377166 RepID=UPI001311D9C1|nr:fimbria/pilus periplasmic chaperone [Stenotrophomonas maltophilia]EKU9960288.1 fimbria/pilus periplasmic chaperone [Stenotrophomonas maltophilia]EKU9984022.1 fimbria/pilus periplasmic chaperone [Stenotrophomonas maltophilia]